MPSNLISANGGIGVTLTSGTFDNAVIHNYIGLDVLGRYLRNRGLPVVDTGRVNVIENNQSTPVVP
jgi:hypothetical protein